MELIEVAGNYYPDAHELPNHGGRPAAKHQKSPGGNSGKKHARYLYLPRSSGRQLAEEQKADRVVTEANRVTLVILPGGKRRFTRATMS